MKKVFGRIFVLWLPFIAIAWLGVSVFFYLITTTGWGLPESMMVIKWILNRLLGIASLLSIVLLPIGIVLLTKGDGTWDYITYGRKLAKKNIKQYWAPLVMLTLIIIWLTFAKNHYGVVSIDGEKILNTTGIILTILENIIGLLYGIGFVKLGLQAGDENKKFSLNTLFLHKWSEIWKSFVAPVVFGLTMLLSITLIGFVISLLWARFMPMGISGLNATSVGDVWLWVFGILFIIAVIGVLYLIYVGMRVGMLLQYVIIDHNDLGIWGMIKYSRNMTKGKIWKIFLVEFLAGLTNILGVLTLWIGLLWTVPLTLIATAKIYQDIDKEYDHKEKIGAIHK